MFEDVKTIRALRKTYNGKMYRSGIGFFRELQDVQARAFQDGALAQKHKELIAIGISVSNGCYG